MFYLNIFTSTASEIKATEHRHKRAHADIHLKVHENLCKDSTEQVTKAITISHGYSTTASSLTFAPD